MGVYPTRPNSDRSATQNTRYRRKKSHRKHRKNEILRSLTLVYAIVHTFRSRGYIPHALNGMSKLGSLITGAGVQTTFSGQSQLDEYIVIGSVSTATPISGLSIEVDGKSFINLVGVQTLLAALAKWKMKAVQGSAIVGVFLRIATGRIIKNTTYKFTNAGATTPDVYVFSDAENGIPAEVATAQINLNSNQTWTAFTALFIQTPANVLSYEVIFANGYSVTLTTFEMDAYFANQYDSETSGELGGVSVIDNSDQKFRSIKINTNATAAGLLVMVVKMPDASWNVLKRLAGK